MGTESKETFTCAHCNNVFYKDAHEDPPICFKEHLPICLKCAEISSKSVDSCVPFEKKLKAYEAKDAFRRSMGI